MELSKEIKRKYISFLFKHQDGLVIANTIAVLAKNGVLQYLKQQSNTTLSKILEAFPTCNEGYLNVALRSLASQGILTYTVSENSIQIEVTTKFEKFEKHIKNYQTFSSLYPFQLKLLQTPLSNPLTLNQEVVAYSIVLKEKREQLKNDSYFINEVALHLEAILILPILVSLNFRANLLNTEAETLITPAIATVFENLALSQNGNLTSKGTFLMSKSYAYGVTTSYFPVLTNIEHYLFGDFNSFFDLDKNGNEKHVLRALNVWGSGGAHATYFKKFDQIIIDLFNQPLHLQPKGIIDVGCGDGTLIAHIFNLIWKHTNRKNDLEQNKLILIGADYNKEALLSTQHNLKKADIWAEVIWGDIGNPSELNEKLEEKFQVSLGNLLNVRSFLDHNRPYNEPATIANTYHYATGAFAHRGKHIKNTEAEQSLVEHFLKWQPYINKHGLLMIELHTVSPNKVSLNLGKTPCTAYDVTHGFSDQYIVGVNTFKRAIQKAGLTIDETHNYVFPNTETPTVSINLIAGKAS